jgi:hypothetical protein
MFNQLFRTLMGLICAFCLSACEQTPDPKPPLTKPIQLDKAGVKESIEFWANPRDSHEKNELIVGLHLKKTKQNSNFVNDLAEKIRQQEQTLPIKVTLTKIDGVDKPVFFKRAYLTPDAPREFNKQKKVPSGSVVYGEYFSSSSDSCNIMLVLADRTEPGFYRVEVEVVQDNPVFNGVKADLFVAYRLYGAK